MNDYGTPDALTILPYWTNGCIGSMEGLYYEASATTPFHFIDQSELSLQPSDPMVGIPYSSSPNVALGVQHLQMLGVKYYIALNKELQQQAAADPSLKLISTFGPFYVSYSGSGGSGPSGTQKQYWKLYLVQGSPRVHSLANQPVVMQGLDNSSQPKYLKVMTTWYDDPSAWDVYLASSGPSSWARVPYGDTNVPVKPEPTTQVTEIVEHNSSISFNVSRVGVPVVVTVSYFPNWQVSGAEGVYRIGPNLMVVVPTSHHVSMSYGYTPVDYEGWGLTLLALVGLFFLIRHPVAPVVAVRRRGLGRRAPPVLAGAAVTGTIRNVWDHEPGPEEPRPPWANGADGPTDAANGGGAPVEVHTGAPAPYDQAEHDQSGHDHSGHDQSGHRGNYAGAAAAGMAVPSSGRSGPGSSGPGSSGPGSSGPGEYGAQPGEDAGSSSAGQPAGDSVGAGPSADEQQPAQGQSGDQAAAERSPSEDGPGGAGRS
jgi:hypothetical protein